MRLGPVPTYAVFLTADLSQTFIRELSLARLPDKSRLLLSGLLVKYQAETIRDAYNAADPERQRFMRSFFAGVKA